MRWGSRNTLKYPNKRVGRTADVVGAAPDREATVPPPPRNALGVRASAHRHQHLRIGLKNSRNVRPVILRQQSGGERNLLLLDKISIHIEGGTPTRVSRRGEGSDKTGWRRRRKQQERAAGVAMPEGGEGRDM